MHYWADLQSFHGFCCYDNIAPNAKCQRVLVLALCVIARCIRSHISTQYIIPGAVSINCGRSFAATYVTCVDWLHGPLTSADINRTASGLQLSVGFAVMQQFATSTARQQSLTEYFQMETSRAMTNADV